MDCDLPYYLDIVDFLPDATFVVDSRRRIVAWNKALEELTGIKKDTLIGAGDYAYAVPFYGERRPVLVDFVFWEDRKNEIHYKLVERKSNHIFGEAFSPHLYGGKGSPPGLHGRAHFGRQRQPDWRHPIHSGY
ncbi:MAG: PAS domain-containing protein [Candidatus Syntrophopropionicum ammoniitolerans]